MQQIHTKVHLTSNFMLWLSDTLFWEAIRTDLLFLCAIVSVWQKSIWLVVLWHKKERPLIVQKTILSNKEQTTQKKWKLQPLEPIVACLCVCRTDKYVWHYMTVSHSFQPCTPYTNTHSFIQLSFCWTIFAFISLYMIEPLLLDHFIYV